MKELIQSIGLLAAAILIAGLTLYATCLEVLSAAGY